MNSKSFDAFTQIIQFIIKYFKLVVFFAVVLIVFSGIYRVESYEVAIVLRFGRLLGDTSEEQIKTPGLHFSLPFFVDEVIKIPVKTVLEYEVNTHYLGGSNRSGPIVIDIEKNGYLLTGDNNIVLIRVMVKYRIDNAALYTLYSCDAGSVIDGVVSGEFTRLIAHTNIDYVLTSGKTGLSSVIMQSSQKILDGLKTGITIINIELTEVTPPNETIASFQAVTNATVNKASRIQKANENASTIKLKAQADARALKQNAISVQNDRLTTARNEMAEFKGLFDQYIKNPQIIVIGTFRQRVNAVLAKAGSSVIIPEHGEPPILILP